ARPVRARASADDGRDCLGRHLLPRDDTRLGARRLRDPAAARASARVRACRARHPRLGRRAGLRALHGARPLPHGQPHRQLARVPGVARQRAALPDRDLARLDAPDLVVPRDDVGDARPVARRARRGGVVRPRDVRAPHRRVRRDRNRDSRSVPRRGAAVRNALADVRNNGRIFFVGGVIAYRALFNWLNPWIFIPTLVFAPIFQVLFFAFLGRAAGLESDRFYVIGNALQLAALPGLFAMTFAISGERW